MVGVGPGYCMYSLYRTVSVTVAGDEPAVLSAEPPWAAEEMRGAVLSARWTGVAVEGSTKLPMMSAGMTTKSTPTPLANGVWMPSAANQSNAAGRLTVAPGVGVLPMGVPISW